MRSREDEFYWREIQSAFKLDRTLINLNNGFTCPCPRVVLEAAWRYMDIINMLPYTYQGMVAAEYSDDPQAHGCRVRV